MSKPRRPDILGHRRHGNGSSRRCTGNRPSSATRSRPAGSETATVRAPVPSEAVPGRAAQTRPGAIRRHAPGRAALASRPARAPINAQRAHGLEQRSTATPAPAAPVGDGVRSPSGSSRVTASARGPPARAPPSRSLVQTKLSVTNPTDPLEHEADAVAARIMSGASPTSISSHSSAPTVSRASGPRPAQARAPPRSVDHVLAAAGTGIPMDRSMRERIEPHLGVDLSARPRPPGTGSCRGRP